MNTIVLVNPEGEENIGSAARAMLNMDCEDLILVAPDCDYFSEAAFNYAVHAKDILKKAKVFDTLDEALSGADISIAVSRRIGQWRKQDFILKELPVFLSEYRDKKVCLVFGREKAGLTNEEIRSCDLVCSIPSSKKFPSLNLAQAVMVVLYELYQANIKENGNSTGTVASREHFNGMLEQLIAALDEMEFFKNVPKWRLESYIKKILIRAKLDEYDNLVIRRLFSRIQGVVKRLKKSSDN